MLGYKAWIRWVVQSQKSFGVGPDGHPLHNYLKFDTDPEGEYYVETADVHEASHFLTEQEAAHYLNERADPDQHQILKVYHKHTIAIFRQPGTHGKIQAARISH